MRLSGEREFILSFLRDALGRGSTGRASELAGGGLDWQEVGALTQLHGLAPLLHSAAERTPETPLPRDFREIIRREHEENTVLGMLMEGSLKGLVTAFRDGGVTFAVHKGVALATLLYPRPELRHFGGDLDILVKKEDYPEARRLLEALGYALTDARFEDHELAYIGEVRFSRSVGGRNVLVDLHTDFVGNVWGKVTRFDMPWFWDRLVEVPAGGYTIPHLPPEEALVYLSIHAAVNHAFDRLIRLCDVDLLVRKYAGVMDWGFLARYTREGGARRALHLTLSYCREFFSTPLPEDFMEEIRPRPRTLLPVPERHLFLRASRPPKWLERYVHFLLLDNPLHFFRSMRIFSSRLADERRIRRSDP